MKTTLAIFLCTFSFVLAAQADEDTAICISADSQQFMKIEHLKSAQSGNVGGVMIGVYNSTSKEQVLSMNLTVANGVVNDLGFVEVGGAATLTGGLQAPEAFLLLRPGFDQIGRDGGLVYLGLDFNSYVNQIGQFPANAESQHLQRFVCIGNQ